jgi:hypothetical protein
LGSPASTHDDHPATLTILPCGTNAESPDRVDVSLAALGHMGGSTEIVDLSTRRAYRAHPIMRIA